MTPEEELRLALNREECARCMYLRETCYWALEDHNLDTFIPPCFMPEQAGGDEDGSNNQGQG